MLRATLLKDRQDLTERTEKAIKVYFRKIKSRVDGTLGRNMERSIVDVQKAFPFGADGLIPDDAEQELADILYRVYTRVTRATYGRINDSGIAGVLEWSANLPSVTSVTSTASARATLIHHTTRKVYQKAIDMAMERGYSIEQLARGVPDEKFPGIRSIAKETTIRARLIARTEVMRTQNLSSLAHYKAQGFEYMRADDVDGGEDDNYIPDGDPYGRTCAERNGQIYTAEDAALIMDHPNGTLNWEPMPRNYKPEVRV